MENQAKKQIKTPGKFFLSIVIKMIIYGILLMILGTILIAPFINIIDEKYLEMIRNILVGFITLWISVKSCFKHYDLNREDVNKVLKYYAIWIIIIPLLLFLLNDFIVTKDKYLNEIRNDSTIQYSIMLETLSDTDKFKQYSEHKDEYIEEQMQDILKKANKGFYKVIAVSYLILIVFDLLYLALLRYLLIKHSLKPNNYIEDQEFSL